MPSDSICMLCNALHFDFQKFCPFLHSRFFSSCFFFPVANFCCIIFFYLNLCLYSFLVLQFSKIAVRIKVFKVDFLCSLLFSIDSYVFFHVLSFLICFSRFLQAVRFDGAFSENSWELPQTIRPHSRTQRKRKTSKPTVPALRVPPGGNQVDGSPPAFSWTLLLKSMSSLDFPIFSNNYILK